MFQPLTTARRPGRQRVERDRDPVVRRVLNAAFSRAIGREQRYASNRFPSKLLDQRSSILPFRNWTSYYGNTKLRKSVTKIFSLKNNPQITQMNQRNLWTGI